MGKAPADIEREIALQRELIERRIRDLEDRVSDDLRDTGHAVAQKVESATETLDQKLHISEQVEQRPFTVLLGALGAGFVLGMMSDRGGGAAPRRASQIHGDTYRYERSPRGGDGMIAQLLGSASGFLGGTLGDEIRGFVAEVFDDLKRDVRSERGDAPQTRSRSRYQETSGETYGSEVREEVEAGAEPSSRYERYRPAAAQRGNGAA